jgi:cellulose synthase/poly-beta-1,6-N-acetylglucosamine synthase-like glycosyltransferase
MSSCVRLSSSLMFVLLSGLAVFYALYLFVFFIFYHVGELDHLCFLREVISSALCAFIDYAFAIFQNLVFYLHGHGTRKQQRYGKDGMAMYDRR